MSQKKDFVDGICENCSFTGMAGDLCPECHVPLVKIDPEINQAEPLTSPDGPETYPLDVLDKEKEKEIDDLTE